MLTESAYPSLASIAAEAPYRVPAHLDLARLRSLVAGERSAAEDHVRSLREDPGYFESVVRERSEHRVENLPDANGRPHPIAKEHLFWDRVLNTVVIDAYGHLSVWDAIHQKVVHLEELYRKHSKNISSTKPLPREYEKALLNFQYFVDQSSKFPIEDMKTGIPASPYLRSMFVREPQKDPSSTVIRFTRKQAKNNDSLINFFYMLWDDQQRFLCGLPNLVDQIGRLIEDDVKQKARLTSWAVQSFSELAVMAELLRQINLYQPWASTFDQKAATDDEDVIKEDYARSTSPLREFHKDFKGISSLSKLGSSFQKRFYYPVDKPRTQSTTADMREAERNLDAFWRAVDQYLLTKSNKSLLDRLQPLLTQGRDIQRTSEWIKPINAPKPATTTESSAEYVPVAKLSLEDTKEPLAIPATKTKTKTRGPAQSASPENEEQETPTETPLRLLPDKQPTFTVSKRALKVFSTLFHRPSQTDQPGEIPWPDFLHAMVSTGFAPEKLYGSVWQFTPRKLDVERSIHFHEPHPSGKIPFNIARRHGRRLNRAYGWHGGMFVLAQ